VPLFVTDALLPAAPVVVVPTEIVAAAPVAPVAPVKPIGPTADVLTTLIIEVRTIPLTSSPLVMVTAVVAI
jgi:hypothetical protein